MIERVVVDASAALRAASEDEEGHEAAATCLEAIAASGALVVAPELFFYEVGSAISRSRAASKRKAEVFIATVETVEPRRPSMEALVRALALAADLKLSYYDAAYLALADELDALLWTEDAALLKRAAGRAVSTRDLAARLAGAPS